MAAADFSANAGCAIQEYISVITTITNEHGYVRIKNMLYVKFLYVIRVFMFYPKNSVHIS